MRPRFEIFWESVRRTDVEYFKITVVHSEVLRDINKIS